MGAETVTHHQTKTFRAQDKADVSFQLKLGEHCASETCRNVYFTWKLQRSVINNVALQSVYSLRMEHTPFLFHITLPAVEITCNRLA